MTKNQQLVFIFLITFVVLMAYYYISKPEFVLVDKNAVDKKVSLQKSLALGSAVSAVVTLIASLLVKEKMRMGKWKMGGCGCSDK